MAGDGLETIRRFWAIQDEGDYSKLASLFAEDALLDDPIYGQHRGGAAIAAFMEKMNTEMAKLGVRFEAEEIAGDTETAWCRWKAVYPDGRERFGVGIYKVRGGKLTYYRDYMNAEPG
ncbi:MAG: nuclear transport factor 2 family protein [Pseudomonadota bacterium]